MGKVAREVRHVAVIGAGTMGAGIAQVVAASGRQVTLLDVSLNAAERGKSSIEKALSAQVDKGKIGADDAKAIASRVHPTMSYDDIADADLVIEAVFESMEVKKDTFAKIESSTSPDVVIATNTSSLPIIELAVSTQRPGKVVGMHFFNPAPVLRLVEVIKTLVTSEETVEFACEFAREIGKEPVKTVDKPGFIVNRILIPMLNEAVFALSEGVASAEDIDKAMKLGAAHPIGPLALIDLIGLDITLEVMDVFYREFQDPKYKAAPLLRQMVRAGWLGRKTGRGFFQY